MESIEREKLDSVIADIIKANVAHDAVKWLEEKAVVIREEKGGTQLNLAFATVPRKTGRHPIKLAESEKKIIEDVYKGLILEDWTVDRLSRLWLLKQLDSSEEQLYYNKIENLFLAAEMHELAALYSSLYFFEYPQHWIRQCSEGIRSNIGLVLESIMYNNPYPAKYLDNLAWNQLVMKAFFTEKDVKRIIGLDERANKELALILVDYANERWAAHRSVNPQLWRLVSGFIDETNFSDIEKAFKSVDIKEKRAAALASHHSKYKPAKNLLESDPGLKSAILKNNLNWNSL